MFLIIVKGVEVAHWGDKKKKPEFWLNGRPLKYGKEIAMGYFTGFVGSTDQELGLSPSGKLSPV